MYIDIHTMLWSMTGRPRDGGSRGGEHPPSPRPPFSQIQQSHAHAGTWFTDSLILQVCFLKCNSCWSAFLPLHSVSYPSAYGIMNWSSINKQTTPGSSHVLLSSSQLLPTDLMWGRNTATVTANICCNSTSLFSFQCNASSLQIHGTVFLRKYIYLWLCCVGLERVMAYSHTWWVLHTWILLHWMIQKKNKPFTFHLVSNKEHFLQVWLLESHLSLLIRCLQLILNGLVLNSHPSHGWFNSHLGECDNVTHGSFDTPE